MIRKIQLWLINRKNIVKMSKFSLLTIGLLVVTWLFDHRFPGLKAYLPAELLLPVDVSLSFLSNLSGVFLTISIFSLTTIITVLNKYASSVTPRMVQDFIDRTDVLSLHGIFVGGFFYSVISLFMLQNVDSKANVMTGSLGVVYSILAMIGFVIFSQRILENLKISNIIENLSQDCASLVNQQLNLRRQASMEESEDPAYQVPILAQATGYLFEIDYDRLAKALQGYKAELVICQRVGEYVPVAATLATLKIYAASGKEAEDLAQADKARIQAGISACFILNMFKNNNRDYHHEIVKLAEIAATNLSPGNSDANTAISCIQKLSPLLGKLFSSGKPYIVAKEEGDIKIIYQNYTVAEELYLVFSPLVALTGNDPLVAQAILEGLNLIYMLAGVSAKSQVKVFFDAAYDQLTQNFQHTIHLSRFQRIKENLEAGLNLAETSAQT